MKKKTFHKIATIIMALALVVTSIYANQAIVNAASKAKATKITLNAKKQTVDIGGQYTLSVKSVSPKNASTSVTWKSSNKKVATVTSKGVVTGVKKGTVTITAVSKSNSKVKATCKITVKNIKPTKITIDPTTKSLEVGKTFSIKVTKYSPATVKHSVTWSTSDAKVATVSKNGVVTAVKEGTATITAKSSENSKVAATCVVTVTAKAAATPTPTPTTAPTTSPSTPSTPSNPSTPVPTTPATPAPGYQKVEPTTVDGKSVYTVATTAKDFQVTSAKGEITFDKSDIDYGYDNTQKLVDLLKGWDKYSKLAVESSSGMEVSLDGSGATKKVTVAKAPKAQYNDTYSVTNTKLSDGSYKVEATSSLGTTKTVIVKETKDAYEITTTRNGVDFTSVIANSKDQVTVKREGVEILTVKKTETAYTVTVAPTYVTNYGILVSFK